MKEKFVPALARERYALLKWSALVDGPPAVGRAGKGAKEKGI
ncbi:MAG: hypothetical protein ACXU9L_14250 [Thermodesulfobacteriota bacterium]